MIIILASFILSCPDANWIVQGIGDSDVDEATKIDMISTITENVEDGCDFTQESERDLRR